MVNIFVFIIFSHIVSLNIYINETLSYEVRSDHTMFNVIIIFISLCPFKLDLTHSFINVFNFHLFLLL